MTEINPTKPEIVLRGIQYSEFASEETHCYRATLYVDGEKWGEVSNAGHGGGDEFHGRGKSYEDLRLLNQRIKATYDPIVSETLTDPHDPTKPFVMQQDLETLCSEIVTDWLIRRDFRKACRTKLLFLKPGEEGVFTVSLKQKGKTWPAETAAAAFLKVRPGLTILNTMPEDDAVRLYRANAG